MTMLRVINAIRLEDQQIEPLPKITGDLLLAVHELQNLAVVLRAAGDHSIVIECQRD